MNMLEYLQNPYGKGAAFASKQIIEDYKDQYSKLVTKFEYKVYKNQNHAIFHIVVPSKSNENYNYDVILEFDLDKLKPEEVDIYNLDFTVFSNCPSFIFTYANIFYREKMICKWLLNKYNPEVKKRLATQRNRFDVIGAERSLYLALLFIRQNIISRVSHINNIAIKSTYITIARYVRSQDEIMNAYKKDKINGKTISKNEAKIAANKRPMKEQIDQGSKKVKKVSKVSGASKRMKRSSVTIKTKKF